MDDAYISFRYAQNAIRGHGLVFNPGERVEGFTNFLWTTLMLPFEGTGVEVGRASMLLGVSFALATLWLVARFTKIADAPRGAGWLAALLLAVDGSFALWAIAGLETPLFAFLVFAGAWLYVREQTDEWQVTSDKERFTPSASLRARFHVSRLTFYLPRLSSPATFPFSGIFFALAAMTRPEGLLVFAITVAHQAAWRVLAERRLFTVRDVLRIVTFGALFAPYWLGRWWYYKSFLPNSFHAKVAASGPAAQIERGWRHLTQFVDVHLGWLIVLPPVALLVRDVRRAKWQVASDKERITCHVPHPLSPILYSRSPAFWTTYFAALIILYAAYIVYVGGDWSVGRFFVPLLPFFYLLFSTGLGDLWKGYVDRWLNDKGKRIEYVASILLIAGMFAASSWRGEYGIYIRGFDAARATEARVAMGKWLKANAPRGTLIAVDAAGQVPYFSELPAIDMFGINDWHIGRMPVATLGQGTPGHEKFDLAYVIARAPEYVIIYGDLFDSVKEYERAAARWTDDLALEKFLTLYKRKK